MTQNLLSACKKGRCPCIKFLLGWIVPPRCFEKLKRTFQQLRKASAKSSSMATTQICWDWAFLLQGPKPSIVSSTALSQQVAASPKIQEPPLPPTRQEDDAYPDEDLKGQSWSQYKAEEPSLSQSPHTSSGKDTGSSEPSQLSSRLSLSSHSCHPRCVGNLLQIEKWYQ